MAASSDAVPNPQALATVTAGTAEPPRTYAVVLHKVPNTTLGIDVTYNSSASWTRNGVFVARVLEDGLVADWNATHEETSWVSPGDFIFQVNGVHGDTVSMIQEMKVKQSLTLHLVRRSAGPPSAPAPKPPTSPSVEEIFSQLQQLSDKDVAGFLLVTLEKRSLIRDEVLEDIFDDVPQAPPPPSAVPAFASGLTRPRPAAQPTNEEAAAAAPDAEAVPMAPAAFRVPAPPAPPQPTKEVEAQAESDCAGDAPAEAEGEAEEGENVEAKASQEAEQDEAEGSAAGAAAAGETPLQ